MSERFVGTRRIIRIRPVKGTRTGMTPFVDHGFHPRCFSNDVPSTKTLRNERFSLLILFSLTESNGS